MFHRGVLPALALLAGAAGAMAQAEHVLRVKDGDSLLVDSGGHQVDVRLAAIDAPEFRQPSGEEARSLLSSLVAGKDVELHLVGGDAYRRVVAHVFMGEMYVNAEMVRHGLAWVLRSHGSPIALLNQEDAARASRVGLWAEAHPTPPWVWRKMRRSSKSDTQAAARAVPMLAGIPTVPTVPTVQCGAKRTCARMDTCAEAIAYLRQCQVRTLDGNRDGVPCNKLCRGLKAP